VAKARSAGKCMEWTTAIFGVHSVDGKKLAFDSRIAETLENALTHTFALQRREYIDILTTLIVGLYIDYFFLKMYSILYLISHPYLEKKTYAKRRD
jgi:hypothetical protein